MIIRSPKELALYVSNYRKKNNLSQSTIGDLVGLKQATISTFENKPESTKLETLFRIIAAVNLEIKISSRDIKNLEIKGWSEEW